MRVGVGYRCHNLHGLCICDVEQNSDEPLKYTASSEVTLLHVLFLLAIGYNLCLSSEVLFCLCSSLCILRDKEMGTKMYKCVCCVFCALGIYPKINMELWSDESM